MKRLVLGTIRFYQRYLSFDTGILKPSSCHFRLTYNELAQAVVYMDPAYIHSHHSRTHPKCKVRYR